jgi:hypothetical protein
LPIPRAPARSAGAACQLILEIEQEERLVMTWKAHRHDSVANDRISRVTYELSAAGPWATLLHVVHDDLNGPTATYSGFGPCRRLAANAFVAQELAGNGQAARH